jgi:type I restriction-modification system DNA methylase subunit
MPTLNWPSRDKDLQQAGTQNTTRERIRLYGEVFTPPETVDTMYNIIPEDVYEKNMSFLDPACGEGAFLTKCLLNKLQKINTETGNREPQWESNAVAALSSIYGIEINEKNVIRCRMNLGNILKKPNQ